MPLQTDYTLKIPKVMYGHFPKNMSEFSNNRFEKTLNKYQHVIEEMEFRGLNVDDFKNYTKKYFIDAVGHDSNSFFKKYITPDLRDTRNIGRQHNNPQISFGKLIGSTITLGAAVSIQSSQSGFIMIWQFTGAVVGAYYNEIALDVNTGAGNMDLCAYDSSFNLYEESGSVSATTGFNYQSLTEFSLNNSVGYLGMQVSSNSCSINIDSASGTRKYKAQAFGASPNPLTGYSSDTSAPMHLKLSHS